MSERRDAYEDLLVAALAGLLPEQRPPPAAAAALRERLLSRVRGPAMRVVRAGEGDWRPLLPGIDIRVLRRGGADGSLTALWRLAPGAKVPGHGHRIDEECLVLEGSVVVHGEQFRAGDYLVAGPGDSHAPFAGEAGALLLIRGEIPAAADSAEPRPR